MATHLPVYTWDGIFAIGLKVKYLFYGGNFAGLPALSSGTNAYPLHVELSMTWLALHAREWDGQNVKVIFPVIWSCYLIAHYYFVRCEAGRKPAVLSIALFFSCITM